MIVNLVSPEVSIIITVFNRKKTFFRALESVLNQSFNEYEIIVVDDGSIDKFHNKLFSLMNYNYRIKFIKHSNRKTALSLNTGLAIAAGKYITFLDSDDEFEKEHISQRVKFMRLNKDVDLIHSPATVIGKEIDKYVPDANNPEKLVHLDECIIGATLFGKNEVFRKLNGFKNVFSYDSDFVKRAEKICKVEKFFSKTYIYYRNSKDSVLSNLKKKINEDR